jgi:P-type Cu+ transporter
MNAGPHQHNTHSGPPKACCATHAPERAPGSEQTHVDARAIFTCPMHPEIQQQGPGSCPICGMALEPLAPSQNQDDTELRKVRRHFWIAAAFSAPLVLLAMLPHLVDLHLTRHWATAFRFAEVILSAPVVLWAGADYYRRGWMGIRQRSPNMYTLIGLGVVVAYAYSLYATLAPGAFPSGMHDSHGLVPVYYEVAAAIIALVLLGEWLELTARGKTSAAIRQLDQRRDPPVAGPGREDCPPAQCGRQRERRRSGTRGGG